MKADVDLETTTTMVTLQEKEAEGCGVLYEIVYNLPQVRVSPWKGEADQKVQISAGLELPHLLITRRRRLICRGVFLGKLLN